MCQIQSGRKKATAGCTGGMEGCRLDPSCRVSCSEHLVNVYANEIRHAADEFDLLVHLAVSLACRLIEALGSQQENLEFFDLFAEGVELFFTDLRFSISGRLKQGVDDMGTRVSTDNTLFESVLRGLERMRYLRWRCSCLRIYVGLNRYVRVPTWKVSAPLVSKV